MREFNMQEKEMIDKMYKNGDTFDDIRLFLHCNEGTLRKYLKDNGYSKRPRNTLKSKEKLSASRKHHFNEHYFETIDTEDKAYWLGFLFADGNVSFGKDKYGKRKGCTIEITLAEKDKNHLYKLLTCLNSDKNYPLEKRIVKNNNKEYVAYRLCLNSVVMGNDLESKGCVPNKSLILKRPIIKSELNRHFIRGYFDGDGCVHINEELNNTTYAVLGTQDMLAFIKEESGISSKITIRQVKRNEEYKSFYEIRIGGINSKILFHNYIYKDAKIYLERKYIKSCKIYKLLLNNSKTA